MIWAICMLVQIGRYPAKIGLRMSIDSAYMEMIRAMADIPATHEIMKALPHYVIPLEHRAITNTIMEPSDRSPITLHEN